MIEVFPTLTVVVIKLYPKKLSHLYVICGCPFLFVPRLFVLERDNNTSLPISCRIEIAVSRI